MLQNEISVSTHDFQLITKNYQTQFWLSRFENHPEEIYNYNDGNEMSDINGILHAVNNNVHIRKKPCM